jgi:alpha-amylase
MPRRTKHRSHLLATLGLAALVAASGCMDWDGHDEKVVLSNHVDDWRDEVIYQILVDRFENGDRGNDQGVRLKDLARYQGGDWLGIENRLDYLEELGVTALWISPVIRNVDTDADVDGYHGYWAQNLEATNPHFGDIAALRSLVDAAHARDMKIIIDIVTNHVGQAFYYDMNLNGVPDIQLQGSGKNGPLYHFTEYDPDFDPRGIQAFTSLGEAGPAPIIFQYRPETGHLPPEPALYQDPAVYNRKGRTIDFDDPDQLLHGDFPGGLKDLKTTRCDVKQSMVDIYAGWIERTNADGFRIDTVKHVEREFWRYFSQRVRTRLADQGKTNFLMFGEVFDGRDDLLGSYTLRDLPSDEDLDRELGCATDGQPITGDQLDSVFYFSQYFQAIRDVFQQAQSTDRIARLWDDRANNWGHEPMALGIGQAPVDIPINFVDNHDVARFLFDLRDRPRKDAQTLLHNALVFTFMLQGIPCLYYGTEQDFDGGNDPANRERLWDTGFDTGHPTFRLVQKLIRVRNAYPALRYGGTQVVYSTEHVADESDAGMFAFERFGNDAGGSYALVVFNTHQENTSNPSFEDRRMQVVAPPGTPLVDALGSGAAVVVGGDGTVDLTMAPMSAYVFVPEAEYKPSAL